MRKTEPGRPGSLVPCSWVQRALLAVRARPFACTCTPQVPGVRGAEGTHCLVHIISAWGPRRDSPLGWRYLQVAEPVLPFDDPKMVPTQNSTWHPSGVRRPGTREDARVANVLLRESALAPAPGRVGWKILLAASSFRCSRLDGAAVARHRALISLKTKRYIDEFRPQVARCEWPGKCRQGEPETNHPSKPITPACWVSSQRSPLFRTVTPRRSLPRISPRVDPHPQWQFNV